MVEGKESKLSYKSLSIQRSTMKFTTKTKNRKLTDALGLWMRAHNASTISPKLCGGIFVAMPTYKMAPGI